jgi:hypothetical protein
MPDAPLESARSGAAAFGDFALASFFVVAMVLGAWLLTDYHRYRAFLADSSSTLYVSAWWQQPVAALRLLGPDVVRRVIAVPATGETITHRSVRLEGGKTIDLISIAPPGDAADQPARSTQQSAVL